MNDPDAIWKPGYDGPPPVIHAAPGRAAPADGPSSTSDTDHAPDGEDRDVSPTDRDAPRSDRRRRRRVLGVGVVAILVATFVALDPIDLRRRAVTEGSFGVDAVVSEREARSNVAPPNRSVFGGPAARRLPDAADELWSIELLTGRDHWVEVIRRDVVLAAVTPPGGATFGRSGGVPSALAGTATPPTSLVAVDASSGERRWTATFAAHPDDLSVVGAVDEVVVIEQRSDVGVGLTALDLGTGAPLWSGDEIASAGHVGLVGTSLIARLPSPANRFVDLVEAASGREVGRIVSEPTASGQPGGWTTDGRGTWYVVDGGLVVGYDLASRRGDRDVIGPVGNATSPRIVIDQKIATVDADGSLVLLGDGVLAHSPATPAIGVSAPVTSITPVAGPHFVVTSPGSIAGATVDEDGIGLTWSLDEGALVDHHPVADGTVLQVATRGGGANKLVDGLRGETIVHLTMTPGALQSLVVAGDGIVTLRTSGGLGPRLAALDLDGRERWWLPGSAPIVVGDDIVVRATPTATVDDEGADGVEPVTSLRLVAYGDLG